MNKLIQKGHPNEVTELILGQNDYIDQLYGCFRFNNPKGESFSSRRDVEIVLRSGRTIRIVVPERMKIDLPPGAKVVNTNMFRLETIENHRDTMHLLTMRAGWNQVDRDINRMVDMDQEGSFVARLAGPDFDIPVATSSVLPVGRNNTWIGMILVHPELRRQGIANAMMQHCVKYAMDQGKKINGLDATPMGNTVYSAVGYVNSYRIWRSFYELAEFEQSPYDTQHVRVITDHDLDEVIRYDASAYMERERIIRDLYADGQDGCFTFRNDSGMIQGYCFARPGRLRPFVGPFIADTDEIARNLLIAASQHLLKDEANVTTFIDTPESKFADRGVYVERVFDQEKKPSGHRLIKSIKPVRDFTRMYQLVHYAEADNLVERFVKSEGIDESSPRVQEFRETMNKSVGNYTETLGFMREERESLQTKFWGITGPEKG